jgi:hypothetical protein
MTLSVDDYFPPTTYTCIPNEDSYTLKTKSQ